MTICWHLTVIKILNLNKDYSVSFVGKKTILMNGATQVKQTLSSYLKPPVEFKTSLLCLKECIIASARRRSAFISNPTIIAKKV